MPGEEPLAAARRKLREEMGITCHLRERFSVLFKGEVGARLTEWEFVHVYSGLYEGPPSINLTEVQDWKWINLRKLKAELAERPRDFTIWSEVVVDQFLLGQEAGEGGLIRYTFPGRVKAARGFKGPGPSVLRHWDSDAFHWNKLPGLNGMWTKDARRETW